MKFKLWLELDIIRTRTVNQITRGYPNFTELLTIRHNNDSPHNDSPQLNNDSPQFNNDSPQLNNDSPQFFLLWLYFDNIDINN